MRRGLLTAAILAMVAMPAAATEIYKSYDADGHIVYTDKRDPAADQTVVPDDALTIPTAGTVLDAPMEVNEPPPPLPEEEQPPPADVDTVWTPGYWQWNGAYYWVPGIWILPPRTGWLWTPGYWGYVGGVYAYRGGYWGPHIGFYGGVNYGHGYPGINAGRTSYYGGPGGLTATPTRAQLAAAAEPHVAAVASQRQYAQQVVAGQTVVRSVQPRISPPAAVGQHAALTSATSSPHVMAASSTMTAPTTHLSGAPTRELRAAPMPTQPSRVVAQPRPMTAVRTPQLQH